MMEQLYEWADFQEKSQMLCVADSNPMQQNNMGQVHFAFGPTGVMTIISNEPFFQQQPQQQQQDPQQPQQQQQPQMNTVFTQSLNPYYCFEIAAKKGHIHVLKKIWEWAEGATGSTATNTAFELTSNSRSSGNSLRHQMFSSGQYSAWAHACMSDNTEVLDRLWEFAKELQCQQQVLSVEDFGDFTQASQDGKINTIKKLLNFAASCGMSSDRVRQDMISARRFGPFLAAAQMNRPEALDILYEAATDIVEEQDLRSQMLEANNFEAFNCAVMKGHLQCVEKIYNW